MERTKYTPKRLLSLLLALIMLLGMFPTAALAAEPREIESPGMVFSLGTDGNKSPNARLSAWLTAPEQEAYIVGNEMQATVHCAFATGHEDNPGRIAEVKSLKWYFSNTDTKPTLPQITMSDLKPTKEQTDTVTLDDGTTLEVFKPYLLGLKTDTSKGTTFPVAIKMDPSFGGMTTTVHVWVDFEGVYAIEGNDGKYNKHVTTDALHGENKICFEDLTLGYPVRYESSLSGAKGIPTGTYYSTYIEEEESEYFKVEADDPTLDGYEFLGWAINGEGDSENYVQQGESFVADRNTTLTAMWEKAEETQTYTVKFDGVYTGVSNLPATTFVVKTDNTQVNEPSETPMREGYTFAGWAADKNSTTAVTFPYAISGDTTFYALWTRNQVKITWPTGTPTGVTLAHPAPDVAGGFVTSVDVGSEVTFQITLDERYEIGTVKAGDRVLGSTVNSNIYTYTFTADKDLTVAVGDPTVKKFTISLPQGDGYEATFTDCTKFGFSGFGPALTEAEGATSYTFEYGDSFKIKLEAYADTTATLRVDGTKVFEVDGNSDEPKITPDTYVVNKMYNITVGTKRKITRMVTFSLEPYGGLYTIMPVENGNKIYAPANPEIPGYEFGAGIRMPTIRKGTNGTSSRLTTARSTRIR